MAVGDIKITELNTLLSGTSISSNFPIVADPNTTEFLNSLGTVMYFEGYQQGPISAVLSIKHYPTVHDSLDTIVETSVFQNGLSIIKPYTLTPSIGLVVTLTASANFALSIRLKIRAVRIQVK